MKIGILNGPNLNMLGTREKKLYGNISFENYLQDLKGLFDNAELFYFQSNIEGVLIDKLQEWNNVMNGIIINAGAYTHTSIALADCLAYIKIPVVEVHITNIYAREKYRQHSYLSPYCKAIVAGMGLNSYKYALQFLVESINKV
ncbi:MAG: 3-dehydroquinate dehydratase [Bacteroidia bacterium]|nr:3-dehydroquinate dehydratase [Bacteroidia bacterium]